TSAWRSGWVTLVPFLWCSGALRSARAVWRRGAARAVVRRRSRRRRRRTRGAGAARPRGPGRRARPCGRSGPSRTRRRGARAGGVSGHAGTWPVELEDELVGVVPRGDDGGGVALVDALGGGGGDAVELDEPHR